MARKLKANRIGQQSRFGEARKKKERLGRGSLKQRGSKAKQKDTRYDMRVLRCASALYAHRKNAKLVTLAEAQK